ncbi:MAG: SUMF1/EgtB/PvdO family nonheme iron enzyme [Deltaproteobacteria bacterium]|nr:SUMF1/EgtB/PvdO family nonheme iron enzyme [Deltaproteobacteria bacterium]
MVTRSSSLRFRHPGVLALALGFWLVACGQESRDEASSGAGAPGNRTSDLPHPVVTASAAVTVDAAPTPLATASAVASAAPVVEYESDELPELDEPGETLASQRAALLRRVRAMHRLDDGQIAAIDAAMARAKKTGQGNPESTTHPMTRAECMAKRREAGVRDEKKARCGSPYMVPIFDPATETEEQAKVCVDRYEFPGIPCDYPLTWVSMAQGQEICKAMGKRLCDAHEWEGGCAGALRPPEEEYSFFHDRAGMRGQHNSRREIRWAYGDEKDHAKCGTSSMKSRSCQSSGWKECGSNTFPAGSFPECKSPFGIYDQHGNAAEHMALPLKRQDLGSRGGLGAAEMKGSWFIFQKYEAHTDDCRWRAPSWHDNEGRHHANYHLGFRCCKDVE